MDAQLTKITEEKQDTMQGEQKTANELQEGEYVYYPTRNGQQILCQVLYDKTYNEVNETNYRVQLIACEGVSKVEIKDMTTPTDMINYLNTKVEELRNPELTDEGYTRHLGTNPDIDKKTEGAETDLNRINDLYENKKIDGTKLADCWYAWGSAGQIVGGGTCSCGYYTNRSGEHYRIVLTRYWSFK